eukprot:2812731-Amphidinium_carterae.1
MKVERQHDFIKLHSQCECDFNVTKYFVPICEECVGTEFKSPVLFEPMCNVLCSLFQLVKHQSRQNANKMVLGVCSGLGHYRFEQQKLRCSLMGLGEHQVPPLNRAGVVCIAYPHLAKLTDNVQDPKCDEIT